MPPLATDLRRQLENVVVRARDLAEAAARAALRRWGVDAAEPFEHFSGADKAFRNRLRARGRQAGDRRNESKKTQEIDRLTEELAYEYWHRMLFARFLEENELLMHPDGVAVTLAECEELARSEGAPNGFVLAAKYASRMLPEIFRIDDVLLEVEFPINDRLPLEKLLASLPAPVFAADDSLGWVYQFWQTKKKDEVNKSGQKIDGRTLPAVTQLFTEHYMVEFLLHNTIGAWWCAKEKIGSRTDTDETRMKDWKVLKFLSVFHPCSSVADFFPYLRWKDDGTPAAGAFAGWPTTLREFTMLDPCCGSGHFLVAGFHLLVPLRRHDEGLSAADAVDLVLRENLHGLELDARCTQIAAFALAMAAWKTPGDDGRPLGYRPLPPLNIACSGQGVVGSKADWTKLGNGDKNMVAALGFLHDEFKRAPTLGSLINPRSIAESIFQTGFDPLRGALDRALRKSEVQDDPDRVAVGVAAQGIATAAALMARQFPLVATNVPYLARGKQSEELRTYLADVHATAKADLATAFVERCLDYCTPGGSTALVTPQSWLFLGSYKALRHWMLRQVTWDVVAKLGPGAFETITGEVVNVALLIHTSDEPGDGHEMVGLDVSTSRLAVEKADLLCRCQASFVKQFAQILNPDFRVSVTPQSPQQARLSEHASSFLGLGTGDYSHYGRCFWEFSQLQAGWAFQQGSVVVPKHFGGREYVVAWDKAAGRVRGITDSEREQIHNQDQSGQQAWGKVGVCVSLMKDLKVSLYTGEIFDKAIAVLMPHNSAHHLALWAYCKSSEFAREVRQLDQNVIVANGTLVKVPFDLDRWQKVAAEEYPNGLPEPHSDDPTQWLFKGHPKGSTDPLQVAISRLLGYGWPDQEPDSLDALADADGIVPIPAVRKEAPAADRLREVLRAAFGSEWSTATEDRLLVESGAKSGTSLDDWLRNTFFDKHCARFHQRPFIWHLWDGRKDGFACLVNYHKLDHKRLESLTYSYLQDWINIQASDTKSGKPGADLRLSAAQELQGKLKLILAGEPPHDIFVRWKPLAEQPIGWNPDLNDGVRLNIRPFMTAGVLRKNPNIKWTKDRGNEPRRDKDQFPWFWDGDTFTGERVNDRHYTNAEKKRATDGHG